MGTSSYCSGDFIVIWCQKIPELARGLGRGIREFKDATKEVNKEIEQAGTQPTPATQTKATDTNTNPTPAATTVSQPSSTAPRP